MGLKACIQRNETNALNDDSRMSASMMAVKVFLSTEVQTMRHRRSLRLPSRRRPFECTATGIVIHQSPRISLKRILLSAPFPTMRHRRSLRLPSRRRPLSVLRLYRDPSKSERCRLKRILPSARISDDASSSKSSQPSSTFWVYDWYRDPSSPRDVAKRILLSARIRRCVIVEVFAFPAVVDL